MGYLKFDDSSLTYPELQKHQKQLKKDASIQFLNMLKTFQSREYSYETYPTFGYEIEAQVLQNISSETETRYRIQDDTAYLQIPKNEDDYETVTEFGAWVVEFVPKKPLANLLNGYELFKNLTTITKQIYKRPNKGDLFFFSSFNPFLNTKEFLRDQYNIPFAKFEQYPNKETMIIQKVSKHQQDKPIVQGQKERTLSMQEDEIMKEQDKEDAQDLDQEEEIFNNREMLRRATPKMLDLPKFTPLSTSSNSKIQDIVLSTNLSYRSIDGLSNADNTSTGPTDSIVNNKSVSVDFNDQNQDHKNKVELSLLEEMNIFSASSYLTDHMITQHPRYYYFALNTRLRAQRKPEIVVPLFKDKNTNMDEPLDFEKYPGKIHLDSFAHGMMHSALQLTFASKTIDEARWLTDQFHMLSAIGLAFSASSPIQKGKLTEEDTRWNILVHGSDDRNEKERTVKARKFTQSRYGSVRLFISNDKRNLKKYNDMPYGLNKKVKRFTKIQAKKMGVDLDENLLNHWAQLCHKENISAFKTKLKVDNLENNNHFEAFQSSNWNDVRFKPPPTLTSDIPWRVEFRTMDCQLTPTHNYLNSFFVQILARMIETKDFKLNFYIPMSYTWKNMERSCLRAAVTEQKFFFRKDLFTEGDSEVLELSLEEFMAGSPDKGFIGLIAVMEKYIKFDYKKIVEEAYTKNLCTIGNMRSCFDYFLKLAQGKIPTMATMIRDFVRSHSLYRYDSLVPPDVQHDLVRYMLHIQYGLDGKFNKMMKPFVTFNALSEECLTSIKTKTGNKIHIEIMPEKDEEKNKKIYNEMIEHVEKVEESKAQQ